MQVIGCLICCIFGIIFFRAAQTVYGKNEVNYQQYPCTDAVVIGTLDFHGYRWMVEFTDEEGMPVIGADDKPSESTFHPQKYTLPKRGNTERVYYWEKKHPHSHSINGTPIAYTIHFCNENFYALLKEKNKRSQKLFRIAGVVMIVLGIAVLFFGNA